MEEALDEQSMCHECERDERESSEEEGVVRKKCEREGRTERTIHDGLKTALKNSRPQESRQSVRNT